ncbi:hypothetical protein ABE438_05700 [Bosea sp. TWI1241]|uniref:hypothetical protein n=1 Tax=Bosea sp. TWI1241 TaxID=3148904 RepID=UPI00320ABB9A
MTSFATLALAVAVAATGLVALPARAQLSGDAYSWGAEVSQGNRSTVIAARQAGKGWTVEMECVVGRGRKAHTLRYRGTARWEGGMMLGTLDRGMKITVVPREDGVGVVTSGNDCAQGAGFLTSGGG